VPPAAAISNDKLFLFAKAKDRSIWYRVLDRSHGRDDWLPVDEWMRAGQCLADSGLTAGALDNSLFVFYQGLQTIPQVAPYLTSQPAVLYQRADWSRIPVVLLQGAGSLLGNPGRHHQQVPDNADQPGRKKRADRILQSAAHQCHEILRTDGRKHSKAERRSDSRDLPQAL